MGYIAYGRNRYEQWVQLESYPTKELAEERGREYQKANIYHYVMVKEEGQTPDYVPEQSTSSKQKQAEERQRTTQEAADVYSLTQDKEALKKIQDKERKGIPLTTAETRAKYYLEKGKSYQFSTGEKEALLKQKGGYAYLTKIQLAERYKAGETLTPTELDILDIDQRKNVYTQEQYQQLKDIELRQRATETAEKLSMAEKGMSRLATPSEEKEILSAKNISNPLKSVAEELQLREDVKDIISQPIPGYQEYVGTKEGIAKLDYISPEQLSFFIGLKKTPEIAYTKPFRTSMWGDIKFNNEDMVIPERPTTKEIISLHSIEKDISIPLGTGIMKAATNIPTAAGFSALAYRLPKTATGIGLVSAPFILTDFIGKVKTGGFTKTFLEEAPTYLLFGAAINAVESKAVAGATLKLAGSDIFPSKLIGRKRIGMAADTLVNSLIREPYTAKGQIIFKDATKEFILVGDKVFKTKDYEVFQQQGFKSTFVEIEYPKQDFLFLESEKGSPLNYKMLSYPDRTIGLAEITKGKNKYFVETEFTPKSTRTSIYRENKYGFDLLLEKKTKASKYDTLGLLQTEARKRYFTEETLFEKEGFYPQLIVESSKGFKSKLISEKDFGLINLNIKSELDIQAKEPYSQNRFGLSAEVFPEQGFKGIDLTLKGITPEKSKIILVKGEPKQKNAVLELKGNELDITKPTVLSYKQKIKAFAPVRIMFGSKPKIKDIVSPQKATTKEIKQPEFFEPEFFDVHKLTNKILESDFKVHEKLLRGQKTQKEKANTKQITKQREETMTIEVPILKEVDIMQLEDINIFSREMPKTRSILSMGLMQEPKINQVFSFEAIQQPKLDLFSIYNTAQEPKIMQESRIKQMQKSNIIQESRIKQMQESKIMQEPRVKQMFSFKAIQQPKLDLFSIYNTAQEPKIMQEPRVKQIQEPRTALTPELRINPVIDMPFIDTEIIIGPKLFGMPMADRQVMKKSASYDVLVREGEKKSDRFIKKNKNPLPYNRAFNYGADIVDNTDAATFRLRKAMAKSRENDVRDTPLLFKFRTPKGASRLPRTSFVEKNKYRIDSLGEMKDIPFSSKKNKTFIYSLNKKW